MLDAMDKDQKSSFQRSERAVCPSVYTDTGTVQPAPEHVRGLGKAP